MSQSLVSIILKSLGRIGVFMIQYVLIAAMSLSVAGALVAAKARTVEAAMGSFQAALSAAVAPRG